MNDAPVTGYEFWQASLKGLEPPIDMNKLEFGFWRLKLHKGPPHLIAIYPWQTRIMVQEIDRGGRLIERNPEDCMQAWPFMAAQPVSHDDYKYYTQHGAFPEEIEELPVHDPRQQATPLEFMTDQIRSSVGVAMTEIVEGITTQLQADRAANHRDRLLELQKKVETAFKGEKAPHEAALQGIRDRWRAPMLELSNAIAFIRNALTPFLKAQRDQAKAAAGEGVEVKAKAGTGRRRTGLRTQVSCKINDWPAAALGLIDHPDLRAEIQRLANRVYVAGGELPGCEKIETEKAQ
jgi:hypothetical protein